jgi:nicotinate-nucleotide adenylyltransferase
LISAADIEAMIGEPVRMQVVDVPLIDLSSRDIRNRVAQRRSIRFMVPRAVEVYIAEKTLYRS